MGIRDNALNAKLGEETVDVWGGTVTVRSMSSDQRMAMLRGYDDDGNLHVDLVIACTFDVDTGEAVFTQADYDMLAGGPSGDVEKVASVVMRMSGTALDDDALSDSPLEDSSSN